jgi:hypothetical protein
MQDIVENKWEKYNLNGMEEFADKIYTGILPAEKNVMAGKLQLSLPFEQDGKHFELSPNEKGYIVKLVGSKYKDINYDFNIKNTLEDVVADIIHAMKKIKIDYIIAVETDKMVNEFFSKPSAE